jgi:hypothetical protein
MNAPFQHIKPVADKRTSQDLVLAASVRQLFQET